MHPVFSKDASELGSVGILKEGVASFLAHDLFRDDHSIPHHHVTSGPSAESIVLEQDKTMRSHSLTTQDFSTQSTAMMALANDWNLQRYFDVTKDPCDWDWGVYCNQARIITTLHFSSMDLKGKKILLPSSIRYFSMFLFQKKKKKKKKKKRYPILIS